MQRTCNTCAYVGDPRVCPYCEQNKSWSPSSSALAERIVELENALLVILRLTYEGRNFGPPIAALEAIARKASETLNGGK